MLFFVVGEMRGPVKNQIIGPYAMSLGLHPQVRPGVSCLPLLLDGLRGPPFAVLFVPPTEYGIFDNIAHGLII